MRTHSSFLAAAAALLLTSFLTACGGSTGFPPVITAVKPQSLSYGRTATIYLGGKDLRSSLVVETGGACTNPSFASSSTTDVLVLNCVVNVVGDLPLTIKTDAGAVVYTATLTVPKPQVSVITNKGSFTLELDPQAAPVTVKNFLTYVKGATTATHCFTASSLALWRRRVGTLRAWLKRPGS